MSRTYAGYLVLFWGVVVGLALVLLWQRLIRVEPPPDVLIRDRELEWKPNPENPLNNSLGFRGAEFALARQPGVTRIVVLGDSSTYSQRQPGYVEMLADRYPGRCEFINASVLAYDAMELYVRYERDVLPLDPDIVIAALPNAHFIEWRPSIGPDLLAVSLDHMASLAEAQGDQLMLLALPQSRDASLTPMKPYWSNGDRETEESYIVALHGVMEDSGIPILDSTTLDWPLEFFQDQNHLNADGHERLAARLDETLFAGLCAPDRSP